LETLNIWHHHFDALFLINVFTGTKYCSSVFETDGIRVPVGTYVTLTYSIAPSATDPFSSFVVVVYFVVVYFVVLFILSCVVLLLLLLIFVLTVIGDWLLSSALNK
jgi:hypothetical protein